ncbi:hypothetical protein Tco_1036528 [Tanacetum coccineum]
MFDPQTTSMPSIMPYNVRFLIRTIWREQAYWLPANERASQTSNPNRPVTPFTHKSRPPSQVLASLQKVNAVFPQFEGIIKERTTQKPDYVSEWCYDYAKQFVEQQLVPFYDHFKKHIQAANDIFFKEVREYEQIFDELEAEYEQCVLDNKNLTIEKKNLLIKNDCLIAECLEKDICSIVLTSDIVVPPSSNCLCEDLRSACDREHTKVLELEAEISKQKQLITESEKRFAFLEQNYVCLQLKFQNYKQCIDTSSASNAIFEINKLRQQLQGKDDTIRNLDAQINIMKVLNVGSTEGSCDQQALDTDRIQLKDTITSLRIQLDGLKVENVSLKRRYDELSKANTHSRTAYTENTSFAGSTRNLLAVQIVLWYLDSGCLRHMTGDRARLINFVEKFIGTLSISRLYYVEGPQHNLFSVGQFVDGGLEMHSSQALLYIATQRYGGSPKGSTGLPTLYSHPLNDMMSCSTSLLALQKPLSTSSWLMASSVDIILISGTY